MTDEVVEVNIAVQELIPADRRIRIIKPTPSHTKTFLFLEIKSLTLSDAFSRMVLPVDLVAVEAVCAPALRAAAYSLLMCCFW